VTVSLLDAALELSAAGMNVFPCKTDGSKAPAGAWKQYQSEHTTSEQIHDWFTGDRYGLGIFAGAVSGNLEMLEIEGRAADRLLELAGFIADNGAADLWATINTGWVERSPSGGVHWFYRIADTPVPGNDKIALSSRNETLVETRGEGGFIVVAPTPGTAHGSGQPWTRIWGGPDNTPTITADDRDTLRGLCAALLDERPETVPEHPTATAAPRDGDLSPGDDFEQRTDWAEILEPHGWKHVRTIGRVREWRRPDKTDRGISATTGRATDRDRLYVFSSSTPFEINEPITKFHAHAILNHGGDHRAAARQLRADGYGHRAPVTIPQNTVAITDGTSALKPAPVPATALPSRTDDGNAQLLAHLHAHHIRYVAQRKQWLAWDGHRWAWDQRGIIRELAKHTIRNLDIHGDDDLAKHWARSLSKRALDAMVALASTIEGIVVDAGDLDAHVDALNTPGGIINLTNGALAAPDPACLHTRSTAVTPTPGPTPRWNAFLTDTFTGHPTLTGYVQRLAGYSATGRVTHHVLPFLHGSGQNGKTVFLDVMRKLLGDYATTTGANFLMAGRDQHPQELARLHGMRFVITSEVNEGDRFDEAKVKWLTGGDAVTAHFMHENDFTFAPSHTLWLMGNKQPQVAAGGDSFWRRLRLIEFANKVPDERKNPYLADELIADEGPGILQWVISGAVAVHEYGLQDPAEVLAATRTYAAEEDHVARFIEDRITVAAEGRVDQAELRAIYEKWCRDAGENALNARSYLRELRSRLPIQDAKSHGRRLFKGIVLTGDEGREESSQWWDK
jgi:putative DNA primase/helicase